MQLQWALASTIKEEGVRLGGVSVTGYIDPHELPVDKPVDVLAEFEAAWICHYFSLMDCIVPSVSLGKVGSIDPANGGYFDITIPDFLSDPLVNSNGNTSEEHIGTMLLVLKDKLLRRTVGAMKPKGSTQEKRGLTILQAYPSPVEFTFFH